MMQAIPVDPVYSEESMIWMHFARVPEMQV